jgi:thiol-disulfide isomerase/thioredoxin
MKKSRIFVVGVVFALFVCGNGLYAQKGKGVKKPAYEVKFVMPGLPDSILYVAYYYADKTYMFDTLYLSRKEPYTFVMTGDSALQRGLYIVASEDKVKYLDFIVDSSYFFTIKTKKLNPAKIDIMESLEFINSPENTTADDFFRKRGVYIIAIQDIVKKMKDENADEEVKEKYREQIKQYQDSIRVFQNIFLEKHKNSLFAKIQHLGEEIIVPEPPRDKNGDLLDSTWSYQYYLNHYWDNCDFSEPALIRTPAFYPRFNQYFESVVIPIPDTINKYVDILLDKAKKSPDLFRYIVQTITYKYETSQYVGHDAVFVHMVKTYYKKGLCPWTDEEILKRMIDEAERLDKILIGRVAPHLYMPDTSGKLRSNYDFDKKYTIMWFWDMNCGHCKTATPILKEFYDRAKDSLDIEVYAVCVGTDSVKWKQTIIERGYNWINVGNNTANIDFREVYGTRTTPVVFILDREKKIIAKKIDVKEIETVIRNHEAGRKIR